MNEGEKNGMFGRTPWNKRLEPLEDRFCLECKSKIIKSKIETPSHYHNRKFCNRVCMGLSKARNMNKTMREKGNRVVWNKGKEMSKEYRYICRRRQLGFKMSEEQKQNIRKTIIKTFKSKESWHTPDGSKRISESMKIRRQTMPQKYRDTKPELKTQERLEKAGISFIKQARLPGLPDFLIPATKTIIFVDGCAFHHCDYCKSWKGDMKSKEKDERNNEKLRLLGYRVIRIKFHMFRKK